MSEKQNTGELVFQLTDFISFVDKCTQNTVTPSHQDSGRLAASLAAGSSASLHGSMGHVV